MASTRWDQEKKLMCNAITSTSTDKLQQRHLSQFPTNTALNVI